MKLTEAITLLLVACVLSLASIQWQRSHERIEMERCRVLSESSHFEWLTRNAISTMEAENRILVIQAMRAAVQDHEDEDQQRTRRELGI